MSFRRTDFYTARSSALAALTTWSLPIAHTTRSPAKLVLRAFYQGGHLTADLDPRLRGVSGSGWAGHKKPRHSKECGVSLFRMQHLHHSRFRDLLEFNQLLGDLAVIFFFSRLV